MKYRQKYEENMSKKTKIDRKRMSVKMMFASRKKVFLNKKRDKSVTSHQHFSPRSRPNSNF